MTTKPEIRSLTTHFETLQAQAKEAAQREIDQLRAGLDNLEAALNNDVRPATNVGGDLGFVSTAVEIQRHVDWWLSAAQTVRVVTRVLES